jgi:hypothetical protein
MAYKVILALLEGPHDVAFVYRILKETGFETTTKIIKDLPSPLNLYLSNPKQFLNTSFEDMKIGSVRLSSFPMEVLERGQNTILLFPSGGVSQSEIRKKIITQFNAIKEVGKVGSANNEKELSISILYLLDAENEGLTFRLNAIADEIKEAMGILQQPLQFTNASFSKIDDIDFGVYVFTEPGKNTGRLEDILLPLMKQNNNDIFDDANDYLIKVNEYQLFKGKTNNADVKLISKVDRQKFNYEKSLISVAGQLQTSGKSNVQVIRESSFLPADKILQDANCIAIAKFIENSLI